MMEGSKKQMCYRCNCVNNDDHNNVCIMDAEDYNECINNE